MATENPAGKRRTVNVPSDLFASPIRPTRPTRPIANMLLSREDSIARWKRLSAASLYYWRKSPLPAALSDFVIWISFVIRHS